MYVEEQKLMEISWDNYFLRGIDEIMGELPTPGDTDDLMFDEDGERRILTEEQSDAFDEYEQVYYRFMKAGQEIIEAFGFKANYGIN